MAEGTGEGIQGDPVDTALLKAAQDAGLDMEQVRKDYPRLDVIPFSSERKMMTTIHTWDGRRFSITKGAPGRCWRSVLPAVKGAAGLPLG